VCGVVPCSAVQCSAVQCSAVELLLLCMLAANLGHYQGSEVLSGVGRMEEGLSYGTIPSWFSMLEMPCPVHP
jgi:hypothetical protein